MMLNCEYENCAISADVYMIAGCMDQHISEAAYCDPHHRLFENGGPTCKCGLPFIAGEYTRLILVHKNQFPALINDQRLRKAQKDLEWLQKNAIRHTGGVSGGGVGGSTTVTQDSRPIRWAEQENRLKPRNI